MNQMTLKAMNRPHTSANDKFDLTDPDNLFQAVFRVLVRYQADGLQPGAEHWQSDTRWKRPQLVADIRKAWLDVMGADVLFPWHDDYVLYCWVAVRKLGNAEKRLLCEWFNVETPAKWAGGE